MTQISETAKEKLRSQFPVFQEAARAFYAKELAPGKYKGTSGKFGSYGERGANSSMLRLRFSGGAISQAHMAFLAQAIDKYHITLAHFTTGEALQLHHLQEQEVLGLYQDCLKPASTAQVPAGTIPGTLLPARSTEWNRGNPLT